MYNGRSLHMSKFFAVPSKTELHYCMIPHEQKLSKFHSKDLACFMLITAAIVPSLDIIMYHIFLIRSFTFGKFDFLFMY